MNFTYNNVTPEKFITLNFKSLDNAIRNCEANNLVLIADYIYDPNTDDSYVNGININKENFTIDGQGHSINGLSQSRVFQINSNNVTFKNINFINGNSSWGGGAIYSDVSNGNLSIDSCNFTNNTGDFGGAICIDNMGNILINNSIFINNRGERWSC